METFKQPKIDDYRRLNNREARLINAIKKHGAELQLLVEILRANETIDQRWVAIGVTDLQTGLMALVRAVAQPTTF